MILRLSLLDKRCSKSRMYIIELWEFLTSSIRRYKPILLYKTILLISVYTRHLHGNLSNYTCLLAVNHVIAMTKWLPSSGCGQDIGQIQAQCSFRRAQPGRGMSEPCTVHHLNPSVALTRPTATPNKQNGQMLP